MANVNRKKTSPDLSQLHHVTEERKKKQTWWWNNLEYSQQAKWGNSLALLSIGKATAGVRHPTWASQFREDVLPVVRVQEKAARAMQMTVENMCGEEWWEETGPFSPKWS